MHTCNSIDISVEGTKPLNITLLHPHTFLAPPSLSEQPLDADCYELVPRRLDIRKVHFVHKFPSMI